MTSANKGMLKWPWILLSLFLLTVPLLSLYGDSPITKDGLNQRARVPMNSGQDLNTMLAKLDTKKLCVNSIGRKRITFLKPTFIPNPEEVSSFFVRMYGKTFVIPYDKPVYLDDEIIQVAREYHQYIRTQGYDEYYNAWREIRVV